jgi:hypothetical protein
VSDEDKKKGQTKGVLWHVSELLSSLFSFIRQFLSSEITVKQVLTLKAHNITDVDINNSEVNLHTGSTEREHCPNPQISGENINVIKGNQHFLQTSKNVKCRRSRPTGTTPVHEYNDIKKPTCSAVPEVDLIKHLRKLYSGLSKLKTNCRTADFILFRKRNSAYALKTGAPKAVTFLLTWFNTRRNSSSTAKTKRASQICNRRNRKSGYYTRFRD